MPKVSEAHRRARRQQILQAAFTCFGRSGVHGTTMKDICEEADLSAGAVYNYFDGKADIVQALAEQSRGSLDALFDALDDEQPPIRQIAALVDRLEEFVEAPGDSGAGGHGVRVRLWSEALDTPEVRRHLTDNQQQFLRRFVDLIRRAQDDKDLDPSLDPAALARALLAFHQGMVLQRAVDPDTSAAPAFDAVAALLQSAAD